MLNKESLECEGIHYRLQVIFLFIASICVGTGIYEWIPLTNVLQQSFHVGQEQIIFIGSVFSLFYAIGFLIFGWLANYVEIKKLLIVGTLLLMISTFLIGFATNYKLMIVFRAIQGIFAASFAPLGFSIIVKMFPESKRIAGISAITTGFVMAGILGQLYGSIIANSYSWSVVFWLQALIYLMIIISMIFLVPKTDKVSERPTSFIGELVKLLISKSLFPCYVITLTLLFCFVGMYTVMGMFFQKDFGLNNEKILWIRGIGIIGMIGSMVFAKLSKKIGVGNILSLGLVCASIGVLIIGISNNVGLSVAMSVVFVFGITISLPMVVSSIGTLAGKKSGNAMTLYTFVLFIGATVGPIVCNRIIESGSYPLAFIFLAVVLGISFIASLIVRKTI
ncbi:putative MFS family arabinose efflux permease [Clostridium acetobutylicum]|uniref:Predicted MDR-type permease n=1 Tax=Clostridium acetobutylicum (strain ATCC 824 / DSM 792 / JCM 1419 / IAM 19013 / LMG 5710 / NBRC 13948 / NRRL B-527 / VKM B-1787 / 2291 / W) TaxID=272562 RepID=Q97DH1_CLOAB|nr:MULTISPECIES: MFS transporter [Clostridium]AAK81432.1 Predicted MDR-type permease [Clostridium acetobutylicum ATCC 824]ADZ22547.1 MDR-type permease [Clostridium acetobutylicum EA 2018]AEI33347.1 MDR-type permease [Clostridium acetobutylicum DSM 1731]AWV80897.1 MFS transporter [Clostridium acetobutylicum]MBC2393777.1 MFS transporter [Clostridium acetobutylicum]